MKERIWLTWERQRRNRTLSEAMGAELYELDYPLPRFRRWLKATGQTVRILLSERPRLVFAQNPSLVLALLAVWYGRISGRPAIIDAHNAGVFPFRERHGWKNRLVRRIMEIAVHHVMRQAHVTLVSNAALAEYVDRAGGRGFALPDPLPEFGHVAADDAASSPSVLFICTWASDEPYLEVIKAAARIDPRIRIFITGNSKGRERLAGASLPTNVVLTGFVSEERFIQLLHSVDVVMDLTTLDDCLVCGAYEAVGAGQPMVLSDTRALRDYFHQGALFAASEADSIARAIETAVANRAELKAKVEALKQELSESWQQRRLALEALLEDAGQRLPARQPLAK